MTSPWIGEEDCAASLHSATRHGDVPDADVDVVPNVSVFVMLTLTTAPFTSVVTFMLGMVMLGAVAPQFTVAVAYGVTGFPVQYLSEPVLEEDALHVAACLAHGAAAPVPLSALTASL